VTRALASFQRSLISLDAPYDRYVWEWDESGMSEEAFRGESLFFSERLECFHCQGGAILSGSIDYVGKGFPEIEFFNNGLYNIDGNGGYPPPNVVLYEFTLDARDMGRFRAPTLKNITVTAPYMHDGSIQTLEEVIKHYAAGGRTVEDGPWNWVGSESPIRSECMVGFELDEEERTDLRVPADRQDLSKMR